MRGLCERPRAVQVAFLKRPAAQRDAARRRQRFQLLADGRRHNGDAPGKVQQCFHPAQRDAPRADDEHARLRKVDEQGEVGLPAHLSPRSLAMMREK